MSLSARLQSSFTHSIHGPFTGRFPNAKTPSREPPSVNAHMTPASVAPICFRRDRQACRAGHRRIVTCTYSPTYSHIHMQSSALLHTLFSSARTHALSSARTRAISSACTHARRTALHVVIPYIPKLAVHESQKPNEHSQICPKQMPRLYGSASRHNVVNDEYPAILRLSRASHGEQEQVFYGHLFPASDSAWSAPR